MPPRTVPACISLRMFVHLCVKHARSILAGALLLGAWLHAFSEEPKAQSRIPDVVPTDGYVFTTWGPDQGLPSADTWPIIQDRTGYVWIGTGFGIVRFDGVTFTPFNSKNTPAFHGQQVMAIHEDAHGRIWVGILSGGLAIYENGHFVSPAFADTFRYETVDGIFADSAGHTILCTTLGTYMVRGDSLAKLDSLPELPRWGYTGPDGSVYLVARSLLRYNGPSTPATVLVPDGGDTHIITAVLQEEGGKIYVVRLGEVSRYRQRNDRGLTLDTVYRMPGALRMVKDPLGGYFVGTVGYGVVHFDGDTFTHPQGLSVQRGAGRQVHALMISREGGVWATTSGGVYRFSRTFFTILGVESGFAYDYSWLVHLQKRKKVLWIGVGTDGTYRFDGVTKTLMKKKDGMPDDHITDLFESADGRMWFGGANGGLSSYDGSTFRHYPGVIAQGCGRIQSLSEDVRGRVWVGTRKGLFLLDGERLVPYRLADGSTIPGGRHVTHMKDGSIWCIISALIGHIANDTLRLYGNTPDHGFYGVTALMVDTGRVWFGTYGGGLYMVVADSIIDVNKVCPGFGPRILGIHEDHKGYLWINAERELQRVRKADLLAAVADPTRAAFIDVYDHNDGLTDLEFNMASMHSSEQLPDGRLLLASTSGIVSVTPELASRPTAPPPVTIERIIADDNEYPLARHVVLPAGTQRVQIGFTALRFQSPGRIQFRYKLGGVDRDWITVPGVHRTATYTRIGPGSFTFSLSASVNGGPWTDVPVTIMITVEPLFYEQHWVQAAAIILLLAALSAAWQWRTRRVLRRNRQLEEEVQRRVEAEARIRSSLDEKTVMLKEIHHRVKNNMQIISSLFSLQLGNLRDPVVQDMLRESQLRIRSMALVHESLYRSSNLAAIDFREYVQGLAAQIAHAHARDNVRMQFIGESISLSIDQAIPAGLIMNEALANAFKHAFPNGNDGTIIVESRTDHATFVELAVGDDGKGLPEGFNPETVASLGFHLITALTEQLGGTLSVSGEGGTTVKIRFPVG
jgi:two-component sensor histidine kinase/ligand-binding sensor domain-containing protein